MPDITPLRDYVEFAIAVGAVFISIGGLVWRVAVISRDANHRFTEQGKRIGEVEQELRTQQSSVRALEKTDQETEFKVLQLSEGIGHVEGRVEQLIDLMEKQAERRGDMEVRIEGRLSRIEERLNLLLEMRGINKLA